MLGAQNVLDRREERGFYFVVEIETRTEDVASEEKTSLLDHDLLVDIVREGGTASQPILYLCSMDLTYMNSPLRPNSVQYEYANSSGVTSEFKSHSNVSVKF